MRRRNNKHHGGGSLTSTILLFGVALCLAGIKVPTGTIGSRNGTIMMGMIGVAEAATTTSSREERRKKREREQRRIERERRRGQSKPHPGRNTNKQKQQQSQQSQQDESFFESESYQYVSNAASKFFAFQEPRDLFEGSIRAVQSLLLGATIGLVSLVGIPILGCFSDLKSKESGSDHDSSRMAAVIGALIVGGIAGTISTLAGIAAGIYQIGSGLWNTLGAIKASHQGMRWNARTRTWAHYYLESEVAELDLWTNSSAPRSGSRSVQDTGLYDMLDVTPAASGKEIKRAYYKKAKVMHPDKNPGDPEAAAEAFLRLHTAYQTLSDDKKRADYDSYGIHNDNNASDNAAGALFDPSVFFAVVFDFQKVEPYIGELTISSFIDGMIKLSQMSSSFSDAGGVPPGIWEQLWSSDTDLRPRKRQVEIAQNLLSRIQIYVEAVGDDKVMSAEAFRQDSNEEAIRIGASTSSDYFGFMDSLLMTIGSSLRLEAGRYLAFHQSFPMSIVSIPMGIFYQVSMKKNKILRMGRSLTKTVTLARGLYALQSNMTDNPNGEEEKSAEVEDQLVDFIDTAGAYILQDIAKALQGACWRLFSDTGVDSATRKRRAEALEIMGQEFSNFGRQSAKLKKDGTQEECDNPDNNKNDEKNNKNEGAKEKIMRAFEMSQKKS